MGDFQAAYVGPTGDTTFSSKGTGPMTWIIIAIVLLICCCSSSICSSISSGLGYKWMYPTKQ